MDADKHSLAAISRFLAVATQHGEATEFGEYKKATRAFDKLMRAAAS